LLVALPAALRQNQCLFAAAMIENSNHWGQWRLRSALPMAARVRPAVLERHQQLHPRLVPNHSSPPIPVPLGPRRGASVLPLAPSGVTVGGFLASQIKGKALFIPRYRREFGIK
jgi:hypothetical protein